MKVGKKVSEKLPFVQKIEEDWADRKFCQMAIEQDPKNFQRCKYQDEKLVKRAVYLDFENIQFAEDKYITHSYALQLVKRHPEIVQFLPNRLYTRAIVYEALKKDPALIYYVGTTEAYQLKAVETDGAVLKHCTQPSKKVIKTALKNNGHAIQFVDIYDKDYYDYCVLALKSKGTALQFVQRIDNNLCAIAINNDPMALKYVPDNLKQAVEVRAQMLNAEASIYAIEPIHEAAKFACYVNRENILYFKKPLIDQILKDINYKNEKFILKFKIFLRRLGFTIKR